MRQQSHRRAVRVPQRWRCEYQGELQGVLCTCCDGGEEGGEGGGGGEVGAGGGRGGMVREKGSEGL